MAKDIESIDKFDDDSEEKLLSRLQIYEGAWSILVRKTLYVFPQETTKREAENVLRKAWLIYRHRLNQN